MGILDRFRAPVADEWRQPSLGTCSCEEHVEQLRHQAVPAGSSAGGDAGGTVTVGDLLDADALPVRVSGPDEQYLYGTASGERRGPYHYRLTPSGVVSALYDADAPASLDDVLFVQPGIERVLWVDRTVFAVGAPRMCPAGVQAAFVRALLNPRVRRTA